jgi:hypothetical protein
VDGAAEVLLPGAEAVSEEREDTCAGVEPVSLSVRFCRIESRKYSRWWGLCGC